MSKLFTLVIYSAASDSYVHNVVDIIDPHKKYFKAVIGRSGCIKLGEKVILKSLELFKGIEKNKTIILENNPQSFVFNIDNTIPIVSFYGDCMDVELDICKQFIEKLSKKKDYTKVIKKSF